MSAHSKVFEVTTFVTERRTYSIEASDLETAEERALEGEAVPFKVEVTDFGVNQSREIKAAEEVEATR